MDPYSIAQAASAVMKLFGAGQEASYQKRVTQAANKELGRLLPFQRDQFNKRFDITNLLNNLLLQTDADRYNQVGGAEVDVRGDIGDESIKRFDEQAGAVSDQMGRDSTNVAELLTKIQASTQGSLAASEAERQRQLGFQGDADAAAAALPSSIGAGADAAARATSMAQRIALATGAIGAADTGGYAPETHSRVVDEFARRGQKAVDDAVTQATADADVSSYADARAEADRTLGNFTSMVDRLKAKATASRAALAPELALADRQGRNAIGSFEGKSALSKLIAGGTRDIADTYRSGRIAAIGSAGESDVASLNDLFSRLSESARTGYGGQIAASERYENLFTNLINNKVARITGQPTPASPLTTLGGLVGSLSSLIPTRQPARV